MDAAILLLHFNCVSDVYIFIVSYRYSGNIERVLLLLN
jgi:hypothetical protein